MLVQGYKASIMQDENVLGIERMVQFSQSVMSDSLRPHGLQHTKPPRPSPTPGVYSNSCPSLLLGRKVMTNLDSILKSRDITLPTKVCLVKAMVFQWSCMDVRVGL